MMKYILSVSSLCLMLTVLCDAQVRRKPKPPTTTAVPKQSENEMSSAFRELAYRALDAIERLPNVPSAESRETGFDARKLDAEKAIDEAKYKAQTAKDKEILKILSAALFGRTAAKERSALHRDWQKLTQLGIQCGVELKAEFEPDHLSEAGLKQAKEKTCLSQESAILKAWEQQRE
jgi:hypothetical protein